MNGWMNMSRSPSGVWHYWKIGEWMNEQMNTWMNEWINERRNEYMNEYMKTWLNEINNCL